MKLLPLVLSVALACGPGTSRPWPVNTQRFAGVYLVIGHPVWQGDPFSRIEDNETYPKIVVVSQRGMACVLTSDDPDYGRWASTLYADPFHCPHPWRMARPR